MNADLNLEGKMLSRRRTTGLDIFVIPNADFLVLSPSTMVN